MNPSPLEDVLELASYAARRREVRVTAVELSTDRFADLVRELGATAVWSSLEDPPALVIRNSDVLSGEFKGNVIVRRQRSTSARNDG